METSKSDYLCGCAGTQRPPASTTGSRPRIIIDTISGEIKEDGMNNKLDLYLVHSNNYNYNVESIVVHPLLLIKTSKFRPSTFKGAYCGVA